MARKKTKADDNRDQCDICGEWFLCKGLVTHWWNDLNEGSRIRRVAPNVHLCYSCLDESRYFREIEYYKKARGK